MADGVANVFSMLMVAVLMLASQFSLLGLSQFTKLQ